MSPGECTPEEVMFTKEDQDRCDREHDRPMFGCRTCFLFLAGAYVSMHVLGRVDETHVALFMARRRVEAAS